MVMKNFSNLISCSRSRYILHEFFIFTRRACSFIVFLTYCKHPLFGRPFNIGENGHGATKRASSWCSSLRIGCELPPLFDPAWYSAQNPDAKRERGGALLHFLRVGWPRGQSPHPLFDVAWYEQQVSADKGPDFNPIEHYFTKGWKEGLSPHPLFDPVWYREQSSEFFDTSIDPLSHFLARGWRSRCSPHPLFDCGWYLDTNPDVAAAGINPVLHYLSHGGGEGRMPHPLFDGRWYSEHTPEIVASGENPLLHYLSGGWRSGRSPHPLFDTAWYSRHHPTLADGEVAPLVHYLRHAIGEGGDPHELFDTRWYLSHRSGRAIVDGNPLVDFLKSEPEEAGDPNAFFDMGWYVSQYDDVRRSGINPLVHYVTVGRAEARQMHAPNALVSSCACLDLPYEVLRAPPDLTGAKICLVSIYSVDGHIAEHVRFYLSALVECGRIVVAVVSTEGIGRRLELDATLAAGLAVRTNHGGDFAAWATALAVFPGIWRAESVMFTNGDFYGPTDRRRFEMLLADMERSNRDVVALTGTNDAGHGFDSDFWLINRRGLNSDAFVRTFDSIESRKDGRTATFDYKALLSGRIRSGGLSIEILFPIPSVEATMGGASVANWRRLLRRGCPLIRVEALRTAEGTPSRRDMACDDVLMGLIEKDLDETRAGTTRATCAAFPAPKRRFRRPPSRRVGDTSVAAARFDTRTDFVLEIPFETDIPVSPSTAPVAALLCITEVNMIAELRQRLERSPVPIDVFITTDTRERRTEIEALCRDYANGAVTVDIVPDAGLGLSATLLCFERDLQRYHCFVQVDAVGPLVDVESMNQYRFALDNCLGSEEVIASCLHLLSHDDIGVVFSDHIDSVRSMIDWGSSFGAAKNLLSRLGLHLGTDLILDFPTGGVFWGRYAALKPLLDLNWREIPAEAVKRSILHLCEGARLRWLKVARAGNSPATRTLRLVDPPSLRAISDLVHAPLLQTRVRGRGARLSEMQTDVLTRRDPSPRARFNLILPTLKPEQIFGGIATALRVFDGIGSHLGTNVDLRIIVVSTLVDLRSTRSYPGYIRVSAGAARDDYPRTIVDAFAPSGVGGVSVRARDVFLVTAWWTAELGAEFRDAQMSYFGRENPLIYLIQDFEPGFYPWSAEYGLAAATYSIPDTVAIINSEELANFFDTRKLPYRTFVLPYAPNGSIVEALTPRPRERIIVFYGRPSTPRNAFETIVAALHIWQERNPEGKHWKIVSVGEAYETTRLRGISNVSIAGKLSLEDYGGLLSRALVGISLMVSPHPSYPPLEMAQAGMLTISNDFEGKRIGDRHDGIRPLRHVTPDALADLLEDCIAEAEAWVDRLRPHQPVHEISCRAERFETGRLASEVEAIFLRASSVL